SALRRRRPSTSTAGALTMRRSLALALLLAILGALLLPARAVAFDHNFAGSAQLDYHYVPSEHGSANGQQVFDGATVELAAKVAMDCTHHLSATLKVCYGCHGFETDMMSFDLRVVDELNFRIGRFSPSFGN